MRINLSSIYFELEAAMRIMEHDRIGRTDKCTCDCWLDCSLNRNELNFNILAVDGDGGIGIDIAHLCKKSKRLRKQKQKQNTKQMLSE